MIAATSYSQSSFRIDGFVYDTAGTPVAKANITITSLQDANKKQITTSDTSGFFSVPKFSKEKFLIQVNCVGFREFKSEYYYLPEENKLTINDIILHRDIKMLQEVVVKNLIPAITIKEDTIEYKADSFKVKAGDDIEALLKKLPGLKVQTDGTVTAQGQVVKKIKVNGKEFFGGDIKTVTKNLPAEIVDKVQVIDDYGETANFTGFKGNSSDKIINIQLKKDKNNGQFGKAEIDYGTKDRYSGKANFNQFSNSSQTSVFLNANNISSGSFYSGVSNYGSISQISRSANNTYEQLGGVNNVISIVNNKDIGFVTANSSSAPGINKNFTTGLNHSFEARRFKMYGSFLHHTIGNNQQILLQGLQFYDTSIIYNRKLSSQNSTDKGQRIYINTEFQLDSLTSIQFTNSATLNNRVSVGSITNAIANKFDTLSYIMQSGDYTNSLKQYNSNFLLKKKFSKYGRSLLVDLSYINNVNNRDEIQLIDNLIFNTTLSNQKNVVKNRKNVILGTVNITEPIAKRFLLNIYGSVQQQQEQNNINLYGFDIAQNKYLLNSFNSGNFESTTWLYNYGADVKNKQGRFIFTAGFGQQAAFFKRAKNNQPLDNFTQKTITPRASVNYKHSKTLSVIVRYAAFLNSPSSNQLSPITDTLNPFTVFKGNPNLKAEVVNKVDFVVNHVNPINGNIFLVSANYQAVNNKIVQDVSIDPTGKQLISYINADNFKSFNSYFNISKPFFNKLIEITLGSSNSISKAFYATTGKLICVNSFAINHFAQLTINPASWLELNFGNEMSRTSYKTANSTFKSNTNNWFAKTQFVGDKIKATVELRHSRFVDYLIQDIYSATLLNASLEKNIGKKFNVRAMVSDALNNGSNNVGRNLGTNNVTDFSANVIGRYIMIGMAYKFSKLKGVPKQKNIISENN